MDRKEKSQIRVMLITAFIFLILFIAIESTITTIPIKTEEYPLNLSCNAIKEALQLNIYLGHSMIKENVTSKSIILNRIIYQERYYTTNDLEIYYLQNCFNKEDEK